MSFTPEQIEGARFLADRRVALLADRVGFGKSAQFVAACDLVGAQRVTVLCPPVLRVNEAREFDKWSGLGHVVHILKTAKDKVPEDGVVICSYALASDKKMRAKLRARGCDVLILDEAHALKSPSAQRTKAVFGKAGIASTAERVWFVTGTPTPNNASEYYVFAGVAGVWNDDTAKTFGFPSATFDAFVRSFCVTFENNFGLKIVGSREDNRPRLLSMLRPYALARSKPVEGVPLPYIDEFAIEGAAPDFSGIEPETLQRIEDALRAGDWSVLDDPSTSTVRRLVGVAKSKAVGDLAADWLDDNAGGLIVFAAHTGVIDAIQTKVDRISCQSRVIDGRTPAKDRQKIVDDFQAGRIRCIVAHIVAAGEGLTLTAAKRVLIAEPLWTPDGNSQAIARAVRRGQTDEVHASFCYLASSPFDAALSATLARKTRDVMSLQLDEKRAA